MPGNSDTRAVLVMDVCSSTRLYEAVGDTRAHSLIADCMAIATGQIEAEGGTVIKTLGDGLMSSLPTAEAAFIAATGMQHAQAGTGMSIRVGINFGPVLEHEQDVFGDTVNVAAHLTSHAKADEIVLTEEVVRELPQHLLARAQFFDRVSFKGREMQTDVYRVPLDTENASDMTVIGGHAVSARPRVASLLLRYKGQEWVVEQGGGDFAMGRDAACNVVVEGPFVSRQHAAFRVQRGAFHLLDKSANGTWIAYRDQEPVFVKRETVRIQDSGVVSLGEDITRGRENLVYFECRVG